MGKQANEYSYPWLEEGEVPPLPLDRDRIHIISQGVADPVFDYDIVPLTYTESRWMAFVVEADEAALKAIKDVGADVHLACFDLSPGVMDMIGNGDAAFTIDQQQRLQGYMPVVVLHLYNNGAGLLPGANIPSGPGFVDKSNASSVASLAGVDR